MAVNPLPIQSPDRLLGPLIGRVSLKETDEVDALIGTPNPPVPTSSLRVRCPFNRAIGLLQAHAARNSRSTTQCKRGRQACLPSMRGERPRWRQA